MGILLSLTNFHMEWHVTVPPPTFLSLSSLKRGLLYHMFIVGLADVVDPLCSPGQDDCLPDLSGQGAWSGFFSAP